MEARAASDIPHTSAVSQNLSKKCTQICTRLKVTTSFPCTFQVDLLIQNCLDKRMPLRDLTLLT